MDCTTRKLFSAVIGLRRAVARRRVQHGFTLIHAWVLCGSLAWGVLGAMAQEAHWGDSSGQLVEGLIEADVTDIQSVPITDPVGMQLDVLPVIDPQTCLPAMSPRGGCESYLSSYRTRVASIPSEPAAASVVGDLEIQGNGSIGAEATRIWWDELIDRPLGFENDCLAVDVASLTTNALACSPRIKALVAEPQIRQSAVTIADAEFDPRLFLESKYIDTNDPVGNTLTTGNQAKRFRDNTFTTKGGIRQLTRKGGQFELVQRGGYQKNNSIYLQPNPQGTTRLEVNYTQPLWRDSGEAFNRTGIIVAQLRANQASSETRSELENHLREVTRAYWDLYRFRALWLQQQKLVGSARQLYAVVQSRSEFDASQRQVLRAKASLASRQAGLTRAASRIRDAQARLRMLVGSPQMFANARSEWTTVERPLAVPVPVNARQAVIEALEFRSDISGAIQEIHEVSVRVGAAKNQVLPQLDLLLGTYVAGLESGRDPWGAFENQFSDGGPGFSVGLAYEAPIGNRAAKSRLNRNRWELFQVIQQFRQTAETAIMEVEIASRETQTAYHDLLEKRLAIDATESEVAYLTERHRELPARDDSAILLIDNLLDAQERLARQESAFVDAQVAYALSWVELRRATGTLLRFSEFDETDGGTPVDGVMANESHDLGVPQIGGPDR